MQGCIRASIIGVYLGGSSSNPQGTRITSILMELVFLPYSSNMQYIKRGKGEKKKPYFVLLAIDCKETLKHFLGNTQKQGWKMFYLSIESWVQYVTAGNPLPLCKLWNPKCMGIFDVFRKRRKIWSKLNFPKIPHLGLICLTTFLAPPKK